MKWKWGILFLVVLSCSPSPQAGKQTRIKTGHKVITDYWLYLPENFESDKTYPIILFLQGSLGNNRDPRASRNDGPVKYALRESLKDAELSKYVKDSFIIINPHMTAGIAEQRQWNQYSDQLVKIVKEVAEQHNGDLSRVYLTGLSKGAIGGFRLLYDYPNNFKAALLVSGRYSTKDLEEIESIPMWLVHNEKDDRVPVEETYNLVQSLNEKGHSFQDNPSFSLSDSSKVMTILPLDGHDAWNITYAQPTVYQWLLSRK